MIYDKYIEVVSDILVVLFYIIFILLTFGVK
jgi:hypothetical protein